MDTETEPRWLISYTPGACVVLAGPTAVVALDPGTDAESVADDVVAQLWQQLHGGISVRALVGQLTRIDVDRLPRLAVLFFETGADDAGGLRALLRGDVRVLSETGQTVAHGEDVLTWQEVRLAGLERFELDLGGGPGESLPLVHGGVRAGRLRLVAGSPEPTTADDAAPVVAAVPAALPPDAAEPPSPISPRPAPDPIEDTAPMVSDPMSAPIVSAETEEMENGDTELMAAVPPVPPSPPTPPPAPAMIARLRAPDGSSVDLDRPVLIGRAPSNAGFENAQPHLLTVLSPSQDISRTHVLVAPEGDAIVVTDLHSTNGTTLVRPGPAVEREPLPSGESVTVEVGTVLERRRGGHPGGPCCDEHRAVMNTVP